MHSTKPRSLADIHREEKESSQEMLLKRQRHLKARLLLACAPHPAWFRARLLEETHLSETDLTTVELTAPGGPVLTSKHLGALEVFINAYLAGGITQVKGEKVGAETTLSDFLLQSEPPASPAVAAGMVIPMDSAALDAAKVQPRCR